NEGEPQIYLPYSQNPQWTMYMVERTTTPIASVASPTRGAVKAIDRDIPIARFRSFDSIVQRALSKQRFNTMLLGIFATTALLLASIGLYGVMTFLVSQRTREIGIRMALGGEPDAIQRMVLREGILICLTGL